MRSVTFPPFLLLWPLQNILIATFGVVFAALVAATVGFIAKSLCRQRSHLHGLRNGQHGNVFSERVVTIGRNVYGTGVSYSLFSTPFALVSNALVTSRRLGSIWGLFGLLAARIKYSQVFFTDTRLLFTIVPREVFLDELVIWILTQQSVSLPFDCLPRTDGNDCFELRQYS